MTSRERTLVRAENRLQGTRTCSACGRGDDEVAWPRRHPWSKECASCERKVARNGRCGLCRRPRSSWNGHKGCRECWPEVPLREQDRPRRVGRVA